MQVREIMSKDIEIVDRNDNLRTVEERMAVKQLRHLPVLEQGEVVGIPTVSPLMIPLVYCHINSFQRASSVEKPWQGGENRRDGEQRITRYGEAIGSFLLPCAPSGCPCSREGA